MDNKTVVESMSFSERLAKLDDVEKSIVHLVQSAGQCLAEIGKDKTATRLAESQAQDFTRRLQAIEKTIIEQINYLSEVGVGAAHESSAYSQVQVKLAVEEKVNYVYEMLAEFRRRRESATVVSDETRDRAPKIESSELS
ncbi:Mediator of RNA polymerase II transcription subun it 11 [Trichuris trichiura]|uniref:Mediator of RNA polymerase II transcription subunit 11 n=1 Tax=Trichuris trichiura TaxID=36087 RepID=A0A077Z846_TRITR|nr:Mediator of RNA polymerase II transcription subun it 11 [Trichuris trichiura]